MEHELTASLYFKTKVSCHVKKGPLWYNIKILLPLKKKEETKPKNVFIHKYIQKTLMHIAW